jgi:two-component system, cell cycle response regulator
MKTLEALKLDGQLPSPKGVALAILEICRRDNATTADIAKIVQTDPALSGRLIRQANAAINGGRSIASVPEAILRVGLGAVRQLALGFSLVDQYQQGPCQSFDYQGFWSHSLLMALAMRRLGGLTRVGAPDELFACGLMARIGSLGLATAYPVEYAGIIAEHLGAAELIEQERERLETDHSELTAALLIDWGIPKALAEPIYYHERPVASGFSEGSRPHQLVHLFYLAKCLADLGLAPETERNARTAELMRLGGRIGLDADDFGALVDELVMQWREWGELLRVPASALPAFAEMATPPKSSDESSPASLRVLLVDDETTMRVMMEGILAKFLGHTVYTATNGQEALALAVEVMPQVVVTDWLMPVMDGLELCRALRATDWGQAMYVIMLTGVDAEEEILKAFEAGVDDYVTKPINVRALRARLRAAWHYVKLLESWERDRAQLKQFTAELAISNRRLEQVALTDLLTDLPNRRSGMTALDQAWKGANRTGQPLAVLLIDIDHFKTVNDNHGHAVGDVVLKEVANAIQASARKDDSICRLGGEEFLIICRNTDLKSAVQAAERLRKMVGALKIRVREAEIQTAVSIGVACKEPDTADADALVNGADKALYGAKNAGRDRTCVMTQGKLVYGPAKSPPHP